MAKGAKYKGGPPHIQLGGLYNGDHVMVGIVTLFNSDVPSSLSKTPSGLTSRQDPADKPNEINREESKDPAKAESTPHL